MTMKLSFNLVEDNELRKSLTDFAEGVFKNLARNEITETAKKAAEQKLVTLNIHSLIENQISFFMRNKMSDLTRDDYWNRSFKSIIDESIEKYLGEYLRKMYTTKIEKMTEAIFSGANGSIEKLIKAEIEKYGAELMRTTLETRLNEALRRKLGV